MQKQLTAVALLALVAGTAFAAPRESRTNAGPVNVWGASATTEPFTLNFTGVDGTPYQATHVRFQAMLTSNVAGTWPNDASLRVTPPGGATVSVVLSQTTTTYASEAIDVTLALSGPAAPAGDWTFEPYETFEDGDGSTPESILTDMTVTLDDAPMAPGETPGVAIDLGSLVDGTTVTATAEVPAAAVVWYKFNALDCTSAAGRKLTVGTLNSTMGGDSEIAVYNSDGSAGWANDDSVGLLSQLQFGVGSPIGVDLPAGEYYTAVGAYNTYFYLNFNVQFDAATAMGGTFQLDVLQEFVGAPTAPADAEDLGTLVDNVNVARDITLGASEIKWYKVITADANDGTGRQLKISTLNTVDPTDTEIGMYTDTGELVGSNDDNPYPHSLMTFGFQGTFGDAAGGLKYIALSTFNTNFLAGWNVTSTGAGGTVHLDVVQLTSFPPEAVATLAASGAGQLLTISVTPGTNPASTGITATVNLTETGGSATAALNDSGLNGDVTAGDGIYSLFIANPAGGSDGQAYNLPWTVADAQSRSVTGNVTFSVDTNNSIATAEAPAGSGPLDSLTGNFEFAGDVDIYKINICDAANFSASTLNGGSAADTQFFLFDENGMGIASNDDDPAGSGAQSYLSPAFVSSSGNYYLAISRYNIDPVDSGGLLIWANNPFNTERSPDGPGAGNALAGWTGASFGTDTYTITFTGTCYPTNNTQCSVADVGMAGGVAGHDRLLNNNDFIAFITLFFAQDAQADMGMAGGVAGSDGHWDNNDFIAFIGHFFNDAANCNG